MSKKNLKSSVRWLFNFKGTEAEKKVKEIADELKLTELEVAILWNRGFKNKEDIIEFLNLSKNDFLNPSLMKDADKAAELIVKHIKEGSNIVLFSDFDADGWGAAVSFIYTMRKAGAKINYWTNDRRDGFGMSIPTVEKMLDKFPNTDLVISADNGIVAFDAVDYLKNKGLDVIITDHHEADQSNKVPNADAVVNPNQPGCQYPFKYLCGAGVTWKLSMLVYHYLGLNPNDVYEVIDIVALSTVADVVPLLGENRVIVREGLKRINSHTVEVWNLMREVFKDFYNDLSLVDSEVFGFTYGPAINAMSRMENSIDLPLEAFIDFMDGSATAEETMVKMQVMLDTNTRRKDKSKDYTNAAVGYIIDNSKYDLPALVISHEEFLEGIVGIVAGRVKEQFNRPTVVFTQDFHNNDYLKGSSRSIEGFNMKEALDNIDNATNGELLVKYGGHAMAAGITIKKEKLEEFEQLLVLEALKELDEEDYVKDVIIDYALDADEVEPKHVDIIKSLQPFGQKFSKPLIGIRNFKPTKVDIIGETKEHLVMESPNLKVVSWFGAKQWLSLGSPDTMFLVGSLDFDDWDGRPILNVENYNIVAASR